MIRTLLMLAVLAPAAALASTGQEWQFRVLLDEREVGSHRFRVSDGGGERRVESDARFTVKFLFIDAYTYVHQARERWQGDCLTAIESRTDDNGQQLAVRGTRTAGRFEVAAGKVQAELPTCVMSFAYWNPAMLRQARLLNAQTGEFVDVRVEALGKETIAVRGAPLAAQRYALHAPDFRIDVWYGAGNQWVQLESRTEGGRLLRYLIQ
jgi:hypothetical protein